MTQVSKIKNKKELSLQPYRNRRSKKECYGQFCATKLNNLNEMEKFLQSHKLPILMQEETENLNGDIKTLS